MRLRTMLFLGTTAALIFAGVALSWQRDPLNDALHQFAGQGATDCGVGSQETAENNLMLGSIKRSSQDVCATKAFKSKRPYFVRYDEIATDRDGEVVTLASAMNARGEVKFWNYQWNSKPILKRPSAWKLAIQRGAIKNGWLASAICPEPIVYRGAVGCGTCRSESNIESAGCIIFTSKRNRLSPSE